LASQLLAHALVGGDAFFLGHYGHGILRVNGFPSGEFGGQPPSYGL
jgi:hypothetical protein